MDDNFKIVEVPENTDYQILKSHLKRVSIKLKIENMELDYSEYVSIESLMNGSSINIDASSDIRRTATLVFKGSGSEAIEKINKARAYSCRIYLYVGYSGYVKGKWTDCRWYPKGYFIINQRATNYDEATDTMTLSLSDLYCTLNGDRGGAIKASELEIQAQKGTNMSELIFSLAGTFGNVKEFDIDMIGSEYLDKNGNMRNEVADIGYNQLPYDLNYSQSQSVGEIINTIKDIRPGWEVCFDKYGKLKVKRIPSYVDEKPCFTFTKDILIKEDCTLDNNSVRNEVVVYGKSFSPALSIGRDKYKVLNTDLIKAISDDNGFLIVDLKINDVKRTLSSRGTYVFDINLAFSYGKTSISDRTELTWYPVYGVASFEISPSSDKILALSADISTIDTEGVCKPIIFVKESEYSQSSLKNPKIFAKYSQGKITLIDTQSKIGFSPWKDNGFNSGETPYRNYSLGGFSKETICGTEENDNGMFSVGNMVALDVPVQYLPVDMKYPQNNPYIQKGTIGTSSLPANGLIHIIDMCYDNGNDDLNGCYITFKDDIFDNRTEFDGLFGSYIYRVVSVEDLNASASVPVKKITVEYVCPSEAPVATSQDLNPNSPFNIYDNSVFTTVLSGGVYDSIYTTRRIAVRYLIIAFRELSRRTFHPSSSLRS